MIKSDSDKKISIKSPTRVDLAGGTLDLWPLYNFVGGATTVNLAISIFTYAELTERSDFQILIESDDLKRVFKFANLKEALLCADKEFALFRPLLEFFKPEKGFHLKTRSESPVGGGLGGSSSLTISILKCLALWTGRKFHSANDLVNIAHNLEAELLFTPTGTQDYYPAVGGGINILDYSSSGIQAQARSFSDTPFSKSMSLVYTGRAHHSGLNNFEVLRTAVAKDKTTLQALQELKSVAAAMRTLVEEDRWHDLPELFRQEYKARVKLCPGFSSPEIDELEKISLRAGAESIKICGAGGGGCVMIWSRPENKAHVEAQITAAKFQILKADPVDTHEFIALTKKVFA